MEKGFWVKVDHVLETFTKISGFFLGTFILGGFVFGLLMIRGGFTSGIIRNDIERHLTNRIVEVAIEDGDILATLNSNITRDELQAIFQEVLGTSNQAAVDRVLLEMGTTFEEVFFAIQNQRMEN